MFNIMKIKDLESIALKGFGNKKLLQFNTKLMRLF